MFVFVGVFLCVLFVWCIKWGHILGLRDARMDIFKYIKIGGERGKNKLNLTPVTLDTNDHTVFIVY